MFTDGDNQQSEQLIAYGTARIFPVFCQQPLQQFVQSLAMGFVHPKVQAGGKKMALPGKIVPGQKGRGELQNVPGLGSGAELKIMGFHCGREDDVVVSQFGLALMEKKFPFNLFKKNEFVHLVKMHKTAVTTMVEVADMMNFKIQSIFNTKGFAVSDCVIHIAKC